MAYILKIRSLSMLLFVQFYFVYKELKYNSYFIFTTTKKLLNHNGTSSVHKSLFIIEKI